MRSGACSDVGRLRSSNEDRFFADAEAGIFLVVDGMGGHAAGERAAEIAVDIIKARTARRTGTREKRVREAFALASTAIFEEASRDPQLAGMACVATLAVVEGEEATVGHVGDSRLYLLTRGAMKKMTSDHSPIGELEDAGSISEDAAMHHPRRNEVYRDLGTARHSPDDAEFVEVRSFPLPAASALLLCSDGLTDQVPAGEIRAIMTQHAGEPEDAAQALVEAANEAGGKDNVTVIVAEMAEYASMPSEAAEPDRPKTARWRWFLVGLLTSAALFLAAKPYWEHGTVWPRLRFGVVAIPRTWDVGPQAMPTIAVALEQARPGDRVDVAPGDYHEVIHLQSGVTLSSTVLHGARIEADDVAVLADHVHGARVQGFDLSGPGRLGIVIDHSDLQVIDVRVSQKREAGVKISGSGGAIIEACEIVDNAGPGIVVDGAALPLIQHNLIRNNGHGERMLPGILIGADASPSLYGNIIDQSGAEEIWAPRAFQTRTLMTDNAVSAGKEHSAFKVVGP